MMLKLNELH